MSAETGIVPANAPQSEAVFIARGLTKTYRMGEFVVLPEPSGFTKISPLGVEEQRVNVTADFQEDHATLGDRFRVACRPPQTCPVRIA